MRPDGPESIQALRSGLAEVLVPELRSAYAQDTASMLQMLLESLAAEWDTAAEDLHRDNATLTGLLADLRDAFQAWGGNVEAGQAVNQIDEALAEPDSGSLAITALLARNRQLRGALEQALVAIEDHARVGHALEDVRSAAYEHLREVAGRGWSFWDVASFREYMARYRTERSRMTT